MNPRPLLIAIDATNRIHALWHGTQGNGTAELFFRQLDAIAKFYNPEWLTLCFDSPRSFRRDLADDYKASRTHNADVAELIDQIKTTIREDRPDTPAVEIEGMEADDLLASFARQGSESGYKVLLITGDKDCRQCLVAGSVAIAKTVSIKNGSLALDFETAEQVAARFNVTPQQWPDYQAIIGDKGDDIAGVDGIGPKIAAQLLSTMTLDEILAQPQRCPVSKKRIDAIVRFQARAEVVRQLVTLKTDLQVSPWLA